MMELHEQMQAHKLFADRMAVSRNVEILAPMATLYPEIEDTLIVTVAVSGRKRQVNRARTIRRIVDRTAQKMRGMTVEELVAKLEAKLTALFGGEVRLYVTGSTLETPIDTRMVADVLG